MLHHVLNQPLMHKQRMRPARNIRMDRNRKDELVILPIKIVKVIAPDILYITRIHESMTIRRLFDKHHRRQVVEVPVGRDLDEARLLAANERLHPLVGRLAVVNVCPRVAGAEVVGLAVVVAHAVVVLDAVLEEQLGALFARLPPGRDAAARRVAVVKGCEHAVRLVEDEPLLLNGHVGRVLVRVAVESNLVACVPHGGHVFGEGLEAVARDEPGAFDVILGQQLQHALGTDCAGKVAWELMC